MRSAKSMQIPKLVVATATKAQVRLRHFGTFRKTANSRRCYVIDLTSCIRGISGGGPEP